MSPLPPPPSSKPLSIGSSYVVTRSGLWEAFVRVGVGPEECTLVELQLTSISSAAVESFSDFLQELMRLQDQLAWFLAPGGAAKIQVTFRWEATRVVPSVPPVPEPPLDGLTHKQRFA